MHVVTFERDARLLRRWAAIAEGRSIGPWWYWVFLVGIGPLARLAAEIVNRIDPTIAIRPAATGALVGIGLYFGLGQAWNAWAQRRIYAEPKYSGATEVRASEGGIDTVSPGMTAHFDWSAFEALTLDRELLILSGRHMNDVMVPRAAFATEAAEAAFVAFAEAERAKARARAPA